MDGTTHPVLSPMQFEDYEGRTGERSHITRNESGMIPTGAIAHLRGAEGEIPRAHAKYQGADWERFKGEIAGGINRPVFITVDHGQAPRISEGNNRRDAAVAHGHSHTPVQIRYFGHAERQGSVLDRWQSQLEREA